jgi:hypothetical protein
MQLFCLDNRKTEQHVFERVERLKKWFNFLDKEEKINNNINDNIVKQIADAKSLMDTGALSKDEFNELKTKLLSKL